MEGSFPSEEVDHVNHVRDDNRFGNLRKASHLQNLQNQSLYKNNSSGVVGVCWYGRIKKWVARIKLNGKNKHLGCFINKKEAIRARNEGEIKYNFHQNHGR